MPHLRPDAGEPLGALLGVALLPRRRPHVGALPRRDLDRQIEDRVSGAGSEGDE